MGKTAIVVIATGKYTQFLPQLEESLNTYCTFPFSFVPLTDQADDPRVISRRGWPQTTVMRYHDVLSRVDRDSPWIVHMDADMRVVGPLPLDVLCPYGITAVQHPGYYKLEDPLGLPYERRLASKGCVELGHGQKYFAGAFTAGPTEAWLHMAKCIDEMRESDEACGSVSPSDWQDESYLNRFLIDNPPAKVLGPEFCWPEEIIPPPGITPVVFALNKNHDEMRGLNHDN